MTELTPEIKQLLIKAGNLASASKLVATANARNISNRIEQMEQALDEYNSKVVNINSNISTIVDISNIEALIEKYEDKIRCVENLKNQGGTFITPSTKEEIERLDTRIYERKTFVKDLKELLNGKN